MLTMSESCLRQKQRLEQEIQRLKKQAELKCLENEKLGLKKEDAETQQAIAYKTAQLQNVERAKLQSDLNPTFCGPCFIVRQRKFPLVATTGGTDTYDVFRCTACNERFAAPTP